MKNIYFFSKVKLLLLFIICYSEANLVFWRNSAQKYSLFPVHSTHVEYQLSFLFVFERVIIICFFVCVIVE